MKKHTVTRLRTVILFFVLLLSGSSAILADDIGTPLPETNREPVQATLIEFVAFDNTKQFFLEFVPETFDEGHTTTLIVALHGHGSDMGQIFNGVHGEFNAILDVAPLHNAIVVSPQYRETTSWMGPAAEKDVVQVITEQKQKRRIDRVVMTGASMGGSSTFTFSVLHPELVDAVVSMNGTANHLEYENFQDAISKSYGGTKSEIPMEYKSRSAEFFPERFLGKPLAITIGTQDTIVPPDSARRLANTVRIIGGDVLLIERENEGHRTSYSDAREALEFVFKALDETTSPR